MLRRLLVSLVVVSILGAGSVFANDANPANKAIDAAKAKTKASGSPYGAQSSPNTRMSFPGTVNLEVLGRGLMGSVNYDYAVSEDLVVGAGYAMAPTNFQRTSTSADKLALLVPIYMNYYLAREGRSFYGTVGVNLVANPNEVRNLESMQGGLEFAAHSIVPNFGVGYESRSDNGFLFRVAGYGLFADNFAPWFGFNFGFAF